MPARLLVAIAVLLGTLADARAQRALRLPDKSPSGTVVTASYSWYTNSTLPSEVVIPLPDRKNAEDCDVNKVVYVQFVPGEYLGPADANSRTIASVWRPIPGPPGSGECVVATRWRLGEPGHQQLVARKIGVPTPQIPGGYTAQEVLGTFEANAHAMPFIFLGVAWLDHDAASGASATDLSRVEPLVGFDSPIPRLFGDVGTAPTPLRLLVATSGRNVGSDLHVGISILPLAFGSEYEAIPFQVFASRRFGFGGRQSAWAVGATYNASGALATALGALTGKPG